MSSYTAPAPICHSKPLPGDFCCVPVSGLAGAGIEIGEYLAERLQHHPAELLAYDHAEIYVGQPDREGPHGYTYSAYPSNGRNGLTGKRPLSCPPEKLPGSIWSSGLGILTTVQRTRIIAWCEAHDCVSYSWADYMAIALHALHVPSPGLKGYISGTASLICSQYVDTAYADSGVHLFADQRWPGFVTPADLAAMLLAKSHLSAPGTV